MSAFGPQPAPPLIPPSSPLSFNLISSNSTFVVTGVMPGPANPRHAIGLSKRLAQPWESRPRALPPYPTGLRGAARGAPAPWPAPPLLGETPRGLPHPQRPACAVEGSRGPVGHLHSPFPIANLSVLNRCRCRKVTQTPRAMGRLEGSDRAVWAEAARLPPPARPLSSSLPARKGPSASPLAGTQPSPPRTAAVIPPVSREK